jgi:hypothetical protein
MARMFQQTIINLLGNAGNEAVLLECKDILMSKRSVSPDLQDIVFQLCAKNFGTDVYELILEAYKASELSEDKRRCLLAAGRIENEKILSKVFEWSLSDEVRASDAYLVFVAAGSFEIGRKLGWKFIQKNWDAIVSRMAPVLVSNVVSGTLSGFASVLIPSLHCLNWIG